MMKIQKGCSLPVQVAVVLLLLPTLAGAWPAEVPRTGQTTCYDTAGAVIGCAGTGQDGEYRAGVAWPSPRFKDNGDTVTDKLTGLEWTKDANTGGAMIWYQALGYVKTLNTGDHDDWRLPNVNELENLVDFVVYNLPLPTNPFSNVQSCCYWSSTTDIASTDTSGAWIAGIDGGDGGFYKSYYGVRTYVWPVRGGQCGLAGNSIICLPKTGQTTSYAAGDDGDIQAGVVWPSPRFADHGDTITDKLTGLVWTKNANLAGGTKTWQQAFDYVKMLNTGGHSDWRLPNRRELLSLVDYAQYNPALPKNYPFTNVQLDNYWSSTSSEGYTDRAWRIYMYDGGVDYLGKTSNGCVWPVRGGQIGLFDNLDINGNGIPDIYEYQYGFRGSAGYSADPVNTGIGNYIYDHIVMQLPGVGMGFEFKRTYNSLNPEMGPLGYGWSHSYGVSVQEFDNNTVVTWGDGQRYVYSKQPDGSYQPVFPGIYDSLTKDSGTGLYSINRKDQSVYNFTTEGRLSSITDRNGNTITLSYDGSGYLTSITDTAGRTITVTNDTSGRITAIADPLGRTAGFAYDGNGNLATATDLRGNATTFTYDANHRLLTIVDPMGNTVVSHTYNAKNQVATQADAKGGVTTFTYDNETRITTLVDPLGHTTQHFYDVNYRLIREQDGLGNSNYYSYDSQGNRAAIMDKNGHNTYYDYDANGNVTYKTDALNNVTTITYDADNNPLTRTDAVSSTTTFEYDANGNLIKTTDALGHYTTITYNAQGQPLTITDPEGNTTTNTYDAQGNLKDTTDALGNKTTYTYDTAGRRLTAKNALNQTTTFAYDNNGNVLSITDPLTHAVQYTYDANNKKLTEIDRNGNTTTYGYDAKSLLSSITDALGKTITYGYDSLDRKISETDRLGHTTQYGYDAAGRLTSITDPLNHVTSLSYDAAGNKTGATNPLAKTTAYAYDAVNRLVTVTDPLGNATQTTYDKLGRVTAKTNAKNQTTQYGYDAMGRLIKVTDAAGGIVSYTYDNNGNRLTETDTRGGVTTFTYDGMNRPTQKNEPLGGSHLYTYDEAGNMTGMTDPKGATITYGYDANKRLVSRIYPDTTSVTYSYDANGNKTGMTDLLGSSTYAYDALNRLTSYADAFGSTIGYSYDDEGKRLTMTYPGSKTVQYGYDNAGRLVTVTDWLAGVTTYTYDNAGNLLQTTNPNSTVAAYAYDDAGRLISLQNKKSGGAVIASYAYTLDVLGNQAQVVQTEQLTPSYTPATTGYSYDAENRMTLAGGATVTYDANGNTSATAGDTLTYDYDNRLLQTTTGGAQYGYDGDGLRLTNTAGTVTTKYVYDIGGSLPEIACEKDASGTVMAYYVYGLGLITKILPDDSTSYYHFDSRGSTVAMTDSGENIVNSYAYNTFGEVIGSNQAVDNSFKYLGRYGITADPDNFYHIRARYYQPGTGRFITKDLLSGNDDDTQSLHRYVYALNNPINLIDISGFSSLEGGGGYSWGNGGGGQINFNDFLNEVNPSWWQRKSIKYLTNYLSYLTDNKMFSRVGKGLGFIFDAFNANHSVNQIYAEGGHTNKYSTEFKIVKFLTGQGSTVSGSAVSGMDIASGGQFGKSVNKGLEHFMDIADIGEIKTDADLDVYLTSKGY